MEFQPIYVLRVLLCGLCCPRKNQTFLCPCTSRSLSFGQNLEEKKAAYTRKITVIEICCQLTIGDTCKAASWDDTRNCVFNMDCAYILPANVSSVIGK